MREGQTLVLQGCKAASSLDTLISEPTVTQSDPVIGWFAALQGHILSAKLMFVLWSVKQFEIAELRFPLWKYKRL